MHQETSACTSPGYLSIALEGLKSRLQEDALKMEDYLVDRLL